MFFRELHRSPLVFAEVDRGGDADRVVRRQIDLTRRVEIDDVYGRSGRAHVDGDAFGDTPGLTCARCEKNCGFHVTRSSQGVYPEICRYFGAAACSVLAYMTHEMPRSRIYWHRELPPIDAVPMSDHVLEATSARVPGTLEHRDDLWDRCRRELMARATKRLEQELARLGGDCAHVLAEHIEPRRDERTGEAWMYGRFDYVPYRLPR